MGSSLLATPSPWDRIAAEYAAEVVPLLRCFAVEALQLAAAPRGARVLDVGSGPGTLALEAAAAGARVTAVDISPGMIAQLRARATAAGLPDLEARVADGQALPFEGGSFNAGFSLFGLIFFPDRARGLRELVRVLRPGGRVVVSGWATPEACGGFLEALWASLRAALPWRLSADAPLATPEALEREMSESGARAIEVRSVRQAATFPSPAAAWAWFARMSPQVAAMREASGAEGWRTLSEQVLRRLDTTLGEGPTRFELLAHIGVGRV